MHKFKVTCLGPKCRGKRQWLSPSRFIRICPQCREAQRQTQAAIRVYRADRFGDLIQVPR